MLKYHGIIHHDSDGYWIEFPDLKGCVTEADTYEDLLTNASEALNLYLEDFVCNEKELPKPTAIINNLDPTVTIATIDVNPEIAVPLMIKQIRQENNVSQMEVAEKMGVKYQTYQQVESIKKFNATIKTLRKVAKALDKKLIIDFR